VRVLLERDHLERDAEDLRDLLRQQAVRADLVGRPAQAPPDDLLAEQL